ncbi:unnamed protein product [Penicillium nalgiovense]|nr:unnamed protein product [Penicillium nalgiovense]
MNPTWVMAVPSGDEKGDYLTIDLGGTNLRISRVILKGGGQYELTHTCSGIPEEAKKGNAKDLWLFIVDCFKQFLQTHSISQTELARMPVAFTFSYPVSQNSIAHGVLQRWTKGFDICGVEGEDVVPQLERTFREKGLMVKIVALVNDTTGTLMASSYVEPRTKIGSIFGTGCNAAYIESCGNIPKIRQYGLSDQTPMAINCEYGAFDNSHEVLPFTPYDLMIDRESPRPGQQCYEKMIAGHYLGEIFRHILLDMHERRDAIFRQQGITSLRKQNIMDASDLVLIEKDASEDSRHTRVYLQRRFNIVADAHEALFCRRVAHLVGQRAIRLYACGIAAIILKKGYDSCDVAVDGSVFSKYPSFTDQAMNALDEILQRPRGIQQCIRLTSAIDGSGVGAAVIAATVAAV